MNIKTIKKTDKVTNVPCLVVSEDDGMIVLKIKMMGNSIDTFSGIVLDPGNSTYDVGYYSNTWMTLKFTIFEGELILSND